MHWFVTKSGDGQWGKGVWFGLVLSEVLRRARGTILLSIDSVSGQNREGCESVQ